MSFRGLDIGNGKDDYEIIFKNKDNLLHRDDGPALINKYKEIWYQHGKIHRESGPAVIIKKQILSLIPDKYYYLWGKKLSKNFFLELTQGPIENLPLYLGLGFDKIIEKRLNKKLV